MTISEGRAQMPFIVTTESRRRNEIDEKKRKRKRKDGEEKSKGQDIYMSATVSSSFMCPRVEHGNLLLLANNESLIKNYQMHGRWDGCMEGEKF